jgi:homoserine O-succinyltransferase
VPHSRWNGLAEQDLAARGYQVLTRTEDAEVDAFVKLENSLFLFFQGHPEYEADTLLREYRRDVARYLANEIHAHPSIPHGYLDRDTEHALTALQERAISHVSKKVFASLTTVSRNSTIENTWRSSATHIYRNWVEYVYERKLASRHDAPVNAEYSVSR